MELGGVILLRLYLTIEIPGSISKKILGIFRRKSLEASNVEKGKLWQLDMESNDSHYFYITVELNTNISHSSKGHCSGLLPPWYKYKSERDKHFL